jgi:hypothetical protein
LFSTHFPNLRAIDKNNINIDTRGIAIIEYAQRTYIHEDEVRGMCLNMGNERIEYNGNKEGNEERMKLVETIKSLQKDVQSYKVGNERRRKAKEKQDGFNVKLLQILDRIEKKMDKETKSIKSKSQRSHDRRR